MQVEKHMFVGRDKDAKRPAYFEVNGYWGHGEREISAAASASDDRLSVWGNYRSKELARQYSGDRELCSWVRFKAELHVGGILSIRMLTRSLEIEAVAMTSADYAPGRLTQPGNNVELSRKIFDALHDMARGSVHPSADTLVYVRVKHLSGGAQRYSVWSTVSGVGFETAARANPQLRRDVELLRRCSAALADTVKIAEFAESSSGLPSMLRGKQQA